MAIVGPSGSGKSTLLHLMGTLDRPSTGAVRITGLDVSRFSERQLAALRANRIGFVFQQFFLSEHATALENVADGLLYTGDPIARTPARPPARRSTRVGLGHRDRGPADPALRRRAPTGGHRAGTGGAPAIVLADEPTGNLDSGTGGAILALLEELNAEGATIVVITHDRDLAGRLPRQVEMLDGRIVADIGHRRTVRAHGDGAGGNGEPAVSGASAHPRAQEPLAGDLLRVASVGLRTRRLRAALSSLGIAIGVAAIVAVLGLSASSQAGLLAEIGQLGTNLLEVTNGQTVFGKTAELPKAAPP